jgi:hypothetical protein
MHQFNIFDPARPGLLAPRRAIYVYVNYSSGPTVAVRPPSFHLWMDAIFRCTGKDDLTRLTTLEWQR